ncbi:hypothetical protein SCLCIDRAFT_113814, partial [Scleroderma citrinum Foug A]
PAGLMAGQDLGAGEILQVLVIGDHINRRGRALKVVSPVFEGLKDGQQFLIMGVIIQLRGRQIGDWLELGIGADNGQNASDGIQSIRNPMSENRSGGKSLLQEVESRVAIISEFPRSVFAGKPRERDDDVGVVMDESMVEVRESKEGLDVLNLPQFQPIGDGLDFLCRHRESVGREAESKVLGGGGMELTFLWFGKEIVFAEALEDFTDVSLMGLEDLGVY